METGAVLIGLAQIGVALAGFTTIASVVVQTGVTTSRNLFIVRTLSILLFSLSLILLALAPVLVETAGISGPRLWQVAAMMTMPLWLFSFIVGYFYLMPRVIRDEKNNWFQTILITLCGTAGFATAVMAIFSANAKFWYMLSLMLTLSGALVAIIGLILSFPLFERWFAKPEDETVRKRNS